MRSNEPYSTEASDSLRELLDLLEYEYCRRVLVALGGTEQRGGSSLSSQSIWHEDANLLEKGKSHSHLLKIDAAGFVDWDRETDTVTRGPRFDELSALLSWAQSLSSGTTPNANLDQSINELFDALGHPIRRHVLQSLTSPDLLAVDESVPYPWTKTDDSEEPDLLVLELEQNHLPLLDDYGFVDWDPATETLSRGERFDDVVPVLELISTYRSEFGTG